MSDPTELLALLREVCDQQRQALQQQSEALAAQRENLELYRQQWQRAEPIQQGAEVMQMRAASALRIVAWVAIPVVRALIALLARISHSAATADADTLAVAHRLSASHSSSADSTGARLPGVPVRRSASAPSIRLNVPWSTSSPSLRPRGAPQRRFDALATEQGETCGLAWSRLRYWL